MRQNDIRNLRQVLREAMRASGRKRRDLEVILGLGRGNLERLTDGTLELRVRHIVDLAELLGVPPADFLTFGCPEANSKANRRLADWITPKQGTQAAAQAGAAAERPMTREEIAALVRDEIRSALREDAATAATDSGEPEAG